MPAPREPNTVQPWDRPCLHGGLAWNHAMMTKDGLIFEANSLKQGRLQALTRQQLQAQATQNRERRWVATINPGPFLTGFNDRGFETWKSWEDEPSERVFDYSKLAFPRAQFDPEPVYATMTAVAAGEIDTYRNLEPKSMIPETKSNIETVWDTAIPAEPSL